MNEVIEIKEELTETLENIRLDMAETLEQASLIKPEPDVKKPIVSVQYPIERSQTVH